MNRITRFTRDWYGDRMWPVSQLHREMNRLFTDAFRGLDETPGGESDWAFNPVVDVERDENQYEITVELPGVTMSDVNVDVDNDMLTISGTKERKRTTGEENQQRSERVYGSFQRTFQLPEDSDRDNISARFNDGVLTVRIPRDEEKSRREIRRIDVRPGGSTTGQSADDSDRE